MGMYDNIGSIGQTRLTALIWTCFSVAFLFVALRTAIRLKVMRRLTAEDCWMFAALASLCALCVLETLQIPSLYYMTATLAGKIMFSPDLITHTETYLRYQFPITVIYWTVLWCVKAGFLALYFKLFKELRPYRRTWYALAAFTLLGYAGCWISLAVSCGTLSNFFQFNMCGTDENIWMSNFNVYLSTTVDVFTDICIMAMPLRLIYNVQVSLKQKIGLVCVFGLGFVMIAFSIIRANQILVPKAFVNLTLLMMWSTLASSISVIVGSLPAFKLFLTNRSATRRGYGSSGGSRKQNLSGGAAGLPRGRGVPLGSVSSHKSAINTNVPKRYPESSGSTEEILATDDKSQYIMVKRDIEVTSADEPHRPYPVYQQRPSFGRAI